jgi:hypothetical protein
MQWTHGKYSHDQFLLKSAQKYAGFGGDMEPMVQCSHHQMVSTPALNARPMQLKTGAKGN